MAHVAKWKKDEVAALVKLIKESPVVGLANVDGIPSAQMQQMRARLRADAQIKISKNTLLTLALEEVAKERSGAEDLIPKMSGSTAVITTKISPFRLYRTLEESKTKAPARGGEVAPEDIKVLKGETSFKPGPIVGDLQKAGIPAKIDNGKVVITKDVTLVKAGDRIPQDAAQMLTRLEIFPLIVGVDLMAAYDDGTVYGADALSIDYVGQIVAAHQQAVNASVFAGWAEEGTVEPLIAVAYGKMLALAKTLADKDESVVDDELKETLANLGTAAAAPAEEKAEEPEEPEEEAVSEEDAMGGLGSLFG